MPGAFVRNETVTCDYLDKKLSGLSPKFACKLPNGEELVFMRTDRLMKYLDLVVANARTGKTRVVLRERQWRPNPNRCRRS